MKKRPQAYTIYKRHKVLCKMNHSDFSMKIDLVMHLVQDYPSLEQLRMLFRKESVVPVFAVTSSVAPLFEEVASHFSGGQVVNITKNSDNLLEALQKAYSVSIPSVHSSFTLVSPTVHTLSLTMSHLVLEMASCS